MEVTPCPQTGDRRIVSTANLSVYRSNICTLRMEGIYVTLKAIIFSSQNEWNVQYSTWSPETLTQGDLVSRSLLPRFQFMPTRHGEVPGCGCSLWLPLAELLAPAGFGCKFYPRLIYSSVPFSPNESYPCCQSKSRKKKKPIDLKKITRLRKTVFNIEVDL